MGPLPLEILHVVIDDQVCEGYGFKIVNCFEFENVLQPNASQEIVIRFFFDTSSKYYAFFVFKISFKDANKIKTF